jgi:hypothetical protein
MIVSQTQVSYDVTLQMSIKKRDDIALLKSQKLKGQIKAFFLKSIKTNNINKSLCVLQQMKG